MSPPRTPTEPIPCPSCGAAPTTPAPGPGAADDGDVVETHCEWCGAEYPVPRGDDHVHGAGEGGPGPAEPGSR